MKNILIVVDMQYGFARYEQTIELASKIDLLVSKKIFDKVIATKFVNDKYSFYSKVLNWNRLISDEDRDLVGSIEKNSDIVITKPIYTCVNTAFIQTLCQLNDGEYPDAVFIVGADTDCCVLKISVDLFENGIKPIVLTKYCSSNGGLDSHNAGLLCLRRFIGLNNIIDENINTREDIERIKKQ